MTKSSRPHHVKILANPELVEGEPRDYVTALTFAEQKFYAAAYDRQDKRGCSHKLQVLRGKI